MKKNVKDILIPVIVLVVITLVVGLLLGLVSQIAEVTPAELEQRVTKKLQEVYESEEGYEKVDFKTGDENLDKNIQYFFKSKSESDVYVAVAKGSVRGYSDVVQMYVVFKGNEIVALEKGTHSESPGVSDKAFSQEYYKRFMNIDVTTIDGFEFKGDDANGIDGISQATYSSSGIASAVSEASKFYKQFVLGGAV